MNDAEKDDAFETAVQIVQTVRLQTAQEENEWARAVCDRAHVWGDFYGPATSPHLARAIAHRYLDRQGGELAHLKAALLRFGKLNRTQAIVDIATAFVKAHCELEQLAQKVGPDAAVTTHQQERVVTLHSELEKLVLGGADVPGRRSTVEHSSVQPPTGATLAGHAPKLWWCRWCRKERRDPYDGHANYVCAANVLPNGHHGCCEPRTAGQ